jgi:hypothetical protein
VYISDLNPGADELIEEVAKQSGFTLELSEPARSHSPTRGERAARAVAKLAAEARRARRSARGHPTSGTAQASNYGVLHATTSHDDVAKCSHMLLYLTSQTWTREASGALAAELMTAMDIGVHILLAHEMPGAGQEARHGCEFGDFFACADGNTPEDLLKVCSSQRATRAFVRSLLSQSLIEPLTPLVRFALRSVASTRRLPYL